MLDRQLQETIYQFEHAHGVVEKIEESSQQLADALAGEQAKIIISTLQKFPFILDKIGDLPNRAYAVLVDEAHSSQTGDAAKDLRAALANKTVEEVLAEQEAEEIAEEATNSQDQVESLVRGRGRQPNLSFFAFTATPKAKTLELFGTPVETLEGSRFAPFHLYSMRQAIEEGFILDVLINYTTYKTYFRIEKAIRDDPEYDEKKAKAAIARYQTLHPQNLAQKAQIIVEHFRNHTARKIGGQAKAMVVTSSRLHAVRYKQAIDKYIHEHGYTDVAAVVAFSGTVLADGGSFTEANMNGFPESETARRFATDEYQVHDRGREVPDRLLPAAPPHDVRRQAAQGTQRRPDPVTAQPHSPAQRRHLRPRLPQRGRGHHQGLRAVVRADTRHPDRPEPHVRHQAGTRPLRRAP